MKLKTMMHYKITYKNLYKRYDVLHKNHICTIDNNHDAVNWLIKHLHWYAVNLLRDAVIFFIDMQVASIVLSIWHIFLNWLIKYLLIDAVNFYIEMQ